jgi:hypothetical protein
MRFTRGRKIMVVAAVATVTMFVGVAYAAFDGVIVGSDGVIYACAKADGTVRLAGSSRTCDTTEKAFNWNQRGLRGPTGPQGPQGPAYFARVLTTDSSTLKPAAITLRTWNYSDGTIWINVPDRDVRQCAVTATPVTGSPGATVVRQQVDYANWILLYTYANTTRQQMAADVVLACNY